MSQDRRLASSDTSACSTSIGGTWYLDISPTARGGSINQQVFTGVFTPNLTTDYGVIYVYNADIGQAGTLNGLRRGTFSTAGAGCTPQTAGKFPRGRPGRRTATSRAGSTRPMPSTRIRPT